MADDLTVRSQAAQAAIPAQQGDKPAVDPRRAELDRLKSIAKERHGRVLSDKAIEAMLARREAKLEVAQQQEASKLEFESSQAKETVTGKNEKAQEQNLKKATGAKETRGADGLTPEDRQAVRADPKAGPKLPPANAKPTTPEKAFELLTNMVGLLTVDGQPFDIEAYAKTLKEKPPTPPKDSATPSGKQTAAQPRVATQPQQQPVKPQSNARPESGPATSRLPPGALQTGKGALSNAGPADPGKPGGLLTQLNPGANIANARLSMKIGSYTNLTGTKISGDGLFNAGGGLITGSSFDGMNFNWDAFFSLFIIRSTKDFQEWRKAMKEFRRLEGQFAIGVISLQKTMMKLRQSYEKWKAAVALGSALKNIPKAYTQGLVNSTAGQVQSAGDWEKYRRKSQELVQNLPVDRNRFPQFTAALGQNILTNQQLEEMVTAGALTREQATQYQNDQRDLDRQTGGTSGRLALLADEYAQCVGSVVGPPTEQEQRRGGALRTEFEATSRQLDSQIAELAGDDLGRAMLNEQRTRLNHIAAELHTQQVELENKPPTAAELTRLNELRRDRAAILRQIIAIDTGLRRHEPVNEEYRTVLDERRRELEPHYRQSTRETRDAQVIEYERLAEVSPPPGTPSQEIGAITRPELGIPSAVLPPDGTPPALREDAGARAVDTLHTEAAAGDRRANARKEYGAHDLAFDRKMDVANAAVSRLGSDPFFVQAVDKAIGSALAQAFAMRSEIDAELRQHTAKAQGLINQLMQLLAMSRAR